MKVSTSTHGPVVSNYKRQIRGNKIRQEENQKITEEDYGTMGDVTTTKAPRSSET